ncbi:MAG: PAS domain-containing sensor histidine kinase [Gammaproteobacteria bacterium]|nr:PAS domain-containing sensor histidine kinase [Gammaproteobacteria bacterium]MDH5735404.1 PAS domain-containing sensor histidine kinase [Gammaproteobacteria bacterium]
MSADLQYVDSGVDDFVRKNAFLLDMQSNAVVVLSSSAEIVYLNPAFLKLSGICSEVAKGQSLSQHIPRFRRVEKLIHDCLAENKSAVVKDTLKLKGQDYILPFIFNIKLIHTRSSLMPDGVMLIINEDSEQLMDYFNVEITRLSQRIQGLSDELRSKLKLINALFDNSPVGMMVLDNEATIMQMNRAGKEILQANASLVGVSCKRFYDVDIDGFPGNKKHVLDPEETPAITVAGNKITLLRCSVQSQDEESLIYETFVDISQIENARMNLERAKQTAESANQAKSDFLANMTHELQTPLNIIMGYSQLGVSINNDTDITEIKSSFERILDSSYLLKGFIDDLLDISKAEAGKLVCSRNSELLENVILQVVSECNVLCLDKAIALKLDLDGNLGEYDIDEVRFMQVMRNLLSNALKFSPLSSEILITGSRYSHYLEIRVMDNGPGIPDDELEFIFSKFEQSSKTQSYSGGTGLGLAISREIISAHNGRIYAENRAQGGAAFVIRLPV